MIAQLLDAGRVFCREVRMRRLAGFSLVIGVLVVGCAGGAGPGQEHDVPGGVPDVSYDAPPKEGPQYATGTMPLKGALSTLAEEPLAFTPDAPTYELPVDLEQVVNLDAILGASLLGGGLTEGARAHLATHGMVMVAAGRDVQFFDAYNRILAAEPDEPPILVTSDSLLHLYHLFFDQLLKYVEVEEFVPMLDGMMPAMVAASLNQAAVLDGEMRRAALRNAGFFAVAAKVLHPAFEPPEAVADVVAKELALIEGHEGLAPSPIFNADCPDSCNPCDAYSQRVCAEAGHVCYCEDYSQYVPRGHYTQTPALERYFKAMMWLGRVAFRIRVDIETRMAVLATDALKSVSVNLDGASVPATDLWSRIYRVTGFFTGAADDLTFADYDQAVLDTFGEAFDLTLIEDDERLADLKEALRALRPPRILSNFVSAFLDATVETQGWRFMGQRFAPDSYVLGRMVWNHVGPDLAYPDMASAVSMCFGEAAPSCEALDLDISNCICDAGLDTGVWGACRLMPRGLDVMAVLGSGAADGILDADRRYCHFDDRLGALKDEFAAYTEADWTQTAYWGWLHALRPLVAPVPDGYPTWMTTAAWAFKELNAVLASWAQLRHDTILYVKQSYTPGVEVTSEPSEPVFSGTVEPVPHFYRRLAFLTAYTRDGLDSLGVLPDGLPLLMDQMTHLLESLADIAVKELTAQALDGNDKQVIRQIGPGMEALVQGLASAVAVPPDPIGEPEEYLATESETEGDGLKTTVVADVHTDGNTEQVLEEGVGKIDWVLVVRRTVDGPLVASLGPVFTYYEFPHPMDDRLTDEAWRALLNAAPPARPDWVLGLYGE
jgi:hypothetical protein